MFALRTMTPGDFDEVADLIYLSTNSWYQTKMGFSIFSGDPSVCRVFPEVYHELDKGYALVAEHAKTGRIIGSCFYHPRETHVSLGIMNVHPSYFGAGVASTILQRIVTFAAEQDLPLRLVSSAMNLDSYSLYNRTGFVPFAAYQDMFVDVPKKGIEADETLPTVREATLDDVDAMGSLEFEVSGISRVKDYTYFIENKQGLWKTVVVEGEDGELDGFLVSIDDPGSRMIGPGVSRNADAAEAMIVAQLNRFTGRRVVFLLPVNAPDLVSRMYVHKAKNCELHLGQVLGDSQPVTGIVMPTFLPETG